MDTHILILRTDVCEFSWNTKKYQLEMVVKFSDSYFVNNNRIKNLIDHHRTNQSSKDDIAECICIFIP